MAHVGDPEIDALLAVARSDYALRAPARAAEIEALVRQDAWSEARRAAHKLRGSAATFGFAALGDVGAAIEELLIAADGAPDADVRARIAEMLRDVRSLADRIAKEGA
jgi:HPt (histidine-containing phosphotransfer) domain-containing protein